MSAEAEAEETARALATACVWCGGKRSERRNSGSSERDCLKRPLADRHAAPQN